MATIRNERPMSWFAVNWISAVENAAQTKIGMRNMVIPRARMVNVVTTMFSDPRIDESPRKNTPMKKYWTPIGACAEGRIAGPAGIPTADEDRSYQQQRRAR